MPRLSLERPFVYTFFLLFSTYLLVIKNSVFSFMPRIISFEIDRNIYDLLPPLPNSMSQAYKLGELHERLTVLEQSKENNKNEINKLLQKANEIIGRSMAYPISTKQLHGVLDNIIQYENESSLTQKILGIFSFVNIVWFFSILGITGTIGPVCYYLFKPIILLIKDFCISCAKWLWSILKSYTMKLFYEFMGYFICWYLIFLSSTAHPDTGFFIAFTGVMFYLPMFAVSCKFYKLKERWQNYMSLIALLFGLYVAPIAYQYNSSFLGFLTVMSIYWFLGFYFAAFFAGYIIGFQDSNSVVKCVITSIIFNVAMIFLKLFRVNLLYLNAFKLGILVMSNIILFLALLIHTSRWRIEWSYYGKNNTHNWWRSYLLRQLLMIICLTCSIFFGNVLLLPAMCNTAYVFAGLYILARIGENDFMWKGPATFFTIFGGCIVAYIVSLYLHTHPQILVNMFVWDA